MKETERNLQDTIVNIYRLLSLEVLRQDKLHNN